MLTILFIVVGLALLTFFVWLAVKVAASSSYTSSSDSSSSWSSGSSSSSDSSLSSDNGFGDVQ